MVLENLKVAFIGDCVAEELHNFAAMYFPTVQSVFRRVSSYLPMLSAQKGLPETLHKRLYNPRYRSFYHHSLIEHQFGILDIAPRPDLIVTNVIAEQPPGLLKHKSGVCFFILWKELIKNSNFDSDWIKNECEIVRPLEEEYCRRFFDGLDRMARQYRDIPVLLLLPINLCISLFDMDYELIGMQEYPRQNQDRFFKELKRICKANPNLFVMSFDRLIADKIAKDGLREEYLFPYYANSGVKSDALVRDLTHPSEPLLSEVVEKAVKFHQGNKRAYKGDVRYIHRVVTEEEILDLKAMNIPIPGSDEVKELLLKGDLHSFCYAMNFVERYPDCVFHDEIMAALMKNEKFHKDKLCRNTMLAHMKRNLHPEYLPYIACLLEVHMENMFRDNALYKGWVYETIISIRKKIMEETDFHSQKLYWDFLISKLTKNGVKRIALFPAGRHTRRLLSYLRKINSIEVVAAFDENQSLQNSDIEDVQVINPIQASNVNIDAVIISSDGMEDGMLKRFSEINGYKIPVYLIYGK